jgi:chromosome segregation ATPase
MVGFDRTIGFTIALCSYIGTEIEKEQTMQQMMQQLLANQEKAEANAKANQEDLLARIEAKMDANQAKAAKQEEMLAEISARMDANTKEINATQERMNTNLKDLKEDIKSSQAEMRSIICAFQSELKETIQREIKAAIQSVWSELDETTTC